MSAFYKAVEAHGPRVFSGAIPGINFGPLHAQSAVEAMAIRDGFHVEALPKARTLVFHKDIDGAFVLFTDDSGHVLLEAADAEDIHATE